MDAKFVIFCDDFIMICLLSFFSEIKTLQSNLTLEDMRSKLERLRVEVQGVISDEFYDKFYNSHDS